MSRDGLKKAIIFGAAAGALLSLGVAISIDYFLANSLQGTWWDAAAKDVTKIFGPSCGQNWFAVSLVLVVTMGFLAGIGAVMGIIASAILYRFFKMLK